MSINNLTTPIFTPSDSQPFDSFFDCQEFLNYWKGENDDNVESNSAIGNSNKEEGSKNKEIDVIEKKR